MNENYDDISTLKKQIYLKVMQLEKLKKQANILYNQFCQLRKLEAKFNEWEEVERYYRLKNKLDKFKNEIL